MQCNRFLRGPAISITGQLAILRDTLGYEGAVVANQFSQALAVIVHPENDARHREGPLDSQR